MEKSLSIEKDIKNYYKKKKIIIISLSFLLIVIAFFSLFIGSSSLSFKTAFLALFNSGENVNIIIMQKIRLPRVLAGLISGFALAISGLIMQTCLNNVMASPSTLGVSNAAVLGANIAIIILSNGHLDSNNTSYSSYNPFVLSAFAFIFAILAIALILFIAKANHSTSETLILTGVAFSSLFSAITTLLQYFATDIELSSMVYWSFGELSRASYKQIIIMFILLLISYVVFTIYRKKLDALVLGENYAKTLGINTEALRIVLLLLASLLTATCISFLGIISFVGLISPHIMRKILGNNHSYLLPATGLIGSLILIISDDVARVIMNGFSLPVGAITSLLGAPFFLYIIFRYERKKRI